MKPPRIPYVQWREARPRFSPGPELRAEGYTGKDLRHPDGRWFTAGEATDWSVTFQRELSAARRKQKTGAKQKPVVAPRVHVAPSMRLLFDMYLNPARRPDFAGLAEATKRDYRTKARALELHCPEAWDETCEALTKSVCTLMADRLKVRAGQATAVGAMRLLGMALQWAMDRDIVHLKENPAINLKLAAPAGRLRVASVEEVDLLVATADALQRPEFGDMIMLAIWTGQRQSDRFQLTRFAIKPDKRGRRFDLRQQKTGANVSVPIMPPLAARLDAADRRRKAAGKFELLPQLVVDERKWEPMDVNYYRHVFDDIRVAAAKKLPSIATLRDQDFRDTTVTWLARAGCDLFTICSITGHSYKSADMILKHYLALDGEMADRGMDNMLAWHNRQTGKDEQKDEEEGE